MFGRAKKVTLFDLQTKEEREFVSQLRLSQFLNASTASINNWINAGTQVVVMNRYLLKYSNDKTPWRVPTQEEVDFSFTAVILVRDAETGEITEYASTGICARKLSLNRTTPYARAQKSKGQIVYQDGLQYKFKTDKTPWKEYDPSRIQHMTWCKNGEPHLNH